MDDALQEIPSLRCIARKSLNASILDEATIQNFRHLLQANDLADDILKAINALQTRKGLLLKRGTTEAPLRTPRSLPGLSSRRTPKANVIRRCTRP